MLSTIIIFLIILAVLVLVHELGHFLVARRNGVIAEEFGFGFPPRLIGTYKDKSGKRRWVFGSKEIVEEIKEREETVYSINLIPLGGFVRIKGEDGESKDDPTSFASKSAWTRFKILAAGVAMNFILGFVLLTAAFNIGLPEVVEENQNVPNAKIQIAEVAPQSPAQAAGLQIGDEAIAAVINGQPEKITSIQQLQEIIKANAGQEFVLQVKHPGQQETSNLNVSPRANAPEGQGLLGVVLVKTAFVKHSFFESIKLALSTTYNLSFLIVSFLKDLVVKIFSGENVGAQVAGPVGIAVLTGQAARLGLAYLLQFAAMLSINLAVINFFPFPALDGGRILFLVIEKIKGSPISRRAEGIVHTAGFLFLLGLMALITVKDIMNLKVFDSFKNIF